MEGEWDSRKSDSLLSQAEIIEWEQHDTWCVSEWCEGKRLDKNVMVKVIRSKRKTMSIQLKPDGSIMVRAPRWMRDRDIESFLQEKRAWIEKHRRAMQERQAQMEGLVPYTEAEIRALVKRAREVITQKVRYYAPMVGVDYGRITIRCQRSRWGSCSSKGNLNFNCLLVLLPEDVIDSVVVHELCHRKQMNHSAAFYKEVERVYPEYKRCNKWLKENGPLYLERLPSSDSSNM